MSGPAAAGTTSVISTRTDSECPVTCRPEMIGRDAGNGSSGVLLRFAGHKWQPGVGTVAILLQKSL